MEQVCVGASCESSSRGVWAPHRILSSYSCAAWKSLQGKLPCLGHQLLSGCATGQWVCLICSSAGWVDRINIHTNATFPSRTLSCNETALVFKSPVWGFSVEDKHIYIFLLYVHLLLPNCGSICIHCHCCFFSSLCLPTDETYQQLCDRMEISQLDPDFKSDWINMCCANSI